MAPSEIEQVVGLMCQFKQESEQVSPVHDKLALDYRLTIQSQLHHYNSQPDCQVLVAKLNKDTGIIGVVIGYIWKYLPIYDIEAMGYISDLYVVPGYRGQGVGKTLVTKLEDWFRERGMLYSRLETIVHYSDNEKTYQKLGYETFIIDMRKKL